MTDFVRMPEESDDQGPHHPSTTTRTPHSDLGEPSSWDETFDAIIFREESPLTAVRLTLFLLGCVLFLAAAVTVFAVSHYRLVVATFWILVLSAFGALVYLLQYVMREDDMLPPMARRAVGAMAEEWEYFCQDWREQVLLLTNEPQSEEYNEYTSPTEGPLDTTETASRYTTRPKARSRVFRVLVQPWVPLFSRRRRRRQQGQEENVVI